MGILDGKAAIVTGAGRGIGRGHALHLAANGASVIVNDIDVDEAQKVVDEIAAQGGKASTNDSASRPRATATEHTTAETLAERGWPVKTPLSPTSIPGVISLNSSPEALVTTNRPCNNTSI